MEIKMKILHKLVVPVFYFLSLSAIAHERFMLPTHTLLSGDKQQYVTLTTSISNDIFHPDKPFGDNGKGVQVTALKTLFSMLQPVVIQPDGHADNSMSWQAFQRMSIADTKLSDDGTYRVSLVQPEIAMTTFTRENGAPGRVFGLGAKLPENVTDIVRRSTTSRVETFISLNAPDFTSLKPIGSGLELGGKTHPNDLFVDEKVNFQLLFNGQPIKQKGQIKLIKGGTRHRNDRSEKLLEIDPKGHFTFTPKEAGFYFLVAKTQTTPQQPSTFDIQHFSLYLTLEVFAQ